MKHQHSDNRNLIITILLSLIVMLSWEYFYAAPRKIEAKKQYETKIVEEKKQPQKIQPEEGKKETLLERERIVSSTSDRVKIESPYLHGSISLKGARFDDLTLAGYRKDLNKDSSEMVLLSPSQTKELYFADFGWLGQNVKLPDQNSIWKSDKKTLKAGDSITLSWDNNEGLIFSRIITLDDHYMFSITDRILNNGDKAVSLAPYGLVTRALDALEQEIYILHLGAIGVLEGKLEEVKYSELKGGKSNNYKSKNGWLGITDKYWLTAIIPDAKSFEANFKHSVVSERDRYQVDYMGTNMEVASGSNIEVKTLFFAGAKKVELLDDYAKKYNITLFDRAVDFGWFYFLTKPMLLILNFFYDYFGNFGLALLALTVLVKLLMFPLANKSYKAMSQMKKLQPEIEKIKERTKEDRQRFSKELFTLYKHEKINPMSGCFPILIQIPVFFSLYKVLYVTIEMRHAPFYGWVKDLSAPDPTTIFNLFGLINWYPPSILMIGAWPLLMGITMVLQQRMNPAPTDPTQAMVIKWMPYIFTIMLASLPAGLLIYWTWSNILSVLQQYIISRGVKVKVKSKG